MDQPRLPHSLTRRAALIAGLGAPLVARAQAPAPAAWPSRPITMIAPLAAGSSVDILARMVADQWAQRLGQPVPVENRPAANGNLAIGQLARAPADGYSIGILGQTSVAFNPVLYPSVPFDPAKDFSYIGVVAGVSNALVVRSASPFTSLAELIAAAKAQPGKLTYSSGGVGTTHHVSSAMLAQQAGIEVVHVPYRGAPQGILAVQTGEVDFAYYNISTLLGGIRGGALRPLAVTSATRSTFLPDVPTMREHGFPDYVMTTWMGVATGSGVPAPVVARMAEIHAAMSNDEAVRRRLTELGFELVPQVPQAQMIDYVRAEQERWAPIIRATGARLE